MKILIWHGMRDGTVLLSDTFTGADGTEISARNPDVGPAYTVSNGSFQIASNRGKAITISTHCLALADVGQSDNLSLSAIGNLATTGGGDIHAVAVVFRATDATHWVKVDVYQEGNLIRLIEDDGGAFATRATGAVAVTDGVNFTFKAVIAGTQITAYFNGTAIFTATSSFNQAATLVGPYGFHNNNPTSLIDNFLVTQ